MPTLKSKLHVRPPQGIRQTHRKRKGGFALPAAAIPIAMAAAPALTHIAKTIANPILGKLGHKIGSLFGLGVIRPGATRRLGGKKRTRRC
jgi:hypothetical protein